MAKRNCQDERRAKAGNRQDDAKSPRRVALLGQGAAMQREGEGREGEGKAV